MPPMTTLTITRHAINNGVLRLSVTGEMDVTTCDQLAGTIRKSITTGTLAELIVDLDGLTFMDSSGIRTLVAGRRLAADRGVAFVVTNPRDMVHWTLDVSGVLEILTRP